MQAMLGNRTLVIFEPFFVSSVLEVILEFSGQLGYVKHALSAPVLSYYMENSFIFKLAFLSRDNWRATA